MKPIKRALTILCLGAIAVSFSTVLLARDRGINQSGAVGNTGPAGPGRDPGINQPGAVGNVGRDPYNSLGTRFLAVYGNGSSRAAGIVITSVGRH